MKMGLRASVRLCLCKGLCCCRASPNHTELAEEDAGEVSAYLPLNLRMIEVSSLSDGVEKSMLCVVPPVPT